MPGAGGLTAIELRCQCRAPGRHGHHFDQLVFGARTSAWPDADTCGRLAHIALDRQSARLERAHLCLARIAGEDHGRRATKSRRCLARPARAISPSWMPEIYNKVLGTKFKIVEGYRASADVKLAMERGEVAGNGSESPGLSSGPTLTGSATKKSQSLSKSGLRREPLLPDVPLLTELARNDQEREILASFQRRSRSAVPSASAPACRRSASRHCARPSMKLSLIRLYRRGQKEGAAIGPVGGATVQQLIDNVLGAPGGSEGEGKVPNAATKLNCGPAYIALCSRRSSMKSSAK